MVAGCATGAGCLAMPMLVAAPGFLFSLISLILVGLFSYFLATVSLEIFLHYKNDVNISSIMSKNFGVSGVLLSGIVNTSLMFALLSVYMTGGADVLNQTILPLLGIHISSRVALLVFLIIMIPIFFRGAELIIQANKIVFLLNYLAF